LSGRFVVVIAGGGVAGLEALIALRNLAGERVQIRLLSPEPEFSYRPLTVGKPFDLSPPLRHPLERVAADFGAELRLGALAEVDSAGQTAVTADGDELRYDALLVAVGGAREPAFPAAITFGGQEYVEPVHDLVRDLGLGHVRWMNFLVPPGEAWTLPLYELALMCAGHAYAMGVEGIELTLATPEPAPLAIFGSPAGEEVAKLLRAIGVRLVTSTRPDVLEDGEVVLRPGDRRLPKGPIVAMPRVRGVRVAGLPADEDGFIPVDRHGHVLGLDRVFAAGDATMFPVKQGGIAAQQADAAAASIAFAAGADVGVAPFRPVLRGRLMTAGGDRFLVKALGGDGGQARVSERRLWWPASKVASKYLSPYLAVEESDLAVEESESLPEVPLDLERSKEA
jgi:sulfide:quinone oxidoreductase